jgi:tripartite-type tricarboxylate transporter receptor subunit TctC
MPQLSSRDLFHMLIPRRRFLSLAAFGTGCAATRAWAQQYPARPISLIVGFPAGGPNDILGRLIAQWLSERLGQPVIVDNKAGAPGNIATEAVVRAPADGYTLLLAGPANAIGPSINPNLTHNFLRDIAPVAAITREPLVMLVHPSVPAKTVPDFLAYAKSNPGKVTMASTGNGSSPHVAGLLFMKMTGAEIPVVHYAGGGPALKGMIEGQAQVMFEPMSASIEPVRNGKLRALAVTTAARSQALPGHYDLKRVRARLRSERRDRHRCSCEHAHRGPRQTEPRDQRGFCRSSNEGAPA